MKINLTKFTLSAAMLLSAVSASMASDWITFKSDPGRFSVLMPGPEQPKADVTTGNQPPAGAFTTYLFTQPTDKGVFVVGWVDYAPTFRFGIQAELDANRDNLIKGVSGSKLVSERAIKFGSSPGLEFIAESPALMIKSRVYVIGRRPYMLIAATRKGMEDSANVERFLASFKMNGTPQPASLSGE